MASVLSLADAKSYLGITDGTDDSKIQGFIDAAEASLTKKVGALQATARTSRVEGGGASLVLPTLPIISVTSVTPVNGTALTLSDLNVNARGGMITWLLGGSFYDRWYDVVYSAGRTTADANLVKAIQERVRTQWETQRGPRAARGGPPEPTTGAIPPRESELINNDIQPGFA